MNEGLVEIEEISTQLIIDALKHYFNFTRQRPPSGVKLGRAHFRVWSLSKLSESFDCCTGDY